MVLDEDVVQRNLGGLEALAHGAEGLSLAAGTRTRLQGCAARRLLHCAGVTPVRRDGCGPSLDTASCSRHRPKPQIDIFGSICAHRAHLGGSVASFSLVLYHLG